MHRRATHDPFPTKRVLAKTLIGLVTIFLASGCADMFVAPPPAPGLYNVQMWNYWNSDINGEVGHRLFVKGPTARCEPSRKWNASYRVVSGRLPPGLIIESSYDITGIPQDRGHWIVTLELYDLECGGRMFEGGTQELRFHITGSGRVIQ